MNGEFFQPGGPVLLLLGSQWEIDENFLLESLVVEVAKQLQGYIFYLEHRFYGESFPTG